MSTEHVAAVEEHGHGLVAHQFDDPAQQKEAATLGMWAFLITEILFFGGMILSYTIFRNKFPAGFMAGSHELDVAIGGFNTAVLIVSSFTMALAVHFAQLGNRKKLLLFLGLTLLFGATFLGVKAVEYTEKYEHHLIPGLRFDYHGEFAGEVNPRNVELFMFQYFAMTGVHAAHMVAGVLLLIVWLIPKAYKGAFSAEYFSPVEMFGLYWHFVDIVWIFLYPLLYLIGRHA